MHQQHHVAMKIVLRMLEHFFSEFCGNLGMVPLA